MKFITIFFDFEGQWGIPREEEYDLVKTTKQLLAILAKNNIKAVFNICGIIAEKYPGVVRSIFKSEHEIAIHGYKHEDWLISNPDSQKTWLTLAQTALTRVTGQSPVGFRAPFLFGPKFYNPQLYKLLANKHQWVSNREIRFVEEIIRPDRLNTNPLSKIYSKVCHIFIIRKLVWLLLNIRIIFFENINQTLFIKKGKILVKQSTYPRIIRNLVWLNSQTPPLFRDRILEIPVLSPLDCDLLVNLYPSKIESEAMLKYALDTIKNLYQHSGNFFNLNFHDWIIGTNNRLNLFEEILKYLSSDKSNLFVTSSEIIRRINNQKK